jgi:phospholipase D1/2
MLSATCPAAAVQVVGTLYTHHQKCVLVDTPASETTRRVTAFLGGLDLCAGRYDTPGHTLFRGLHTVFHGDVYNPTFGVRHQSTRCSVSLGDRSLFL